jgi:hypothetical protein
MKRLARHRDSGLLFAGHVTGLFGDRALNAARAAVAAVSPGST